jgi:hypothetical protein
MGTNQTLMMHFIFQSIFFFAILCKMPSEKVKRLPIYHDVYDIVRGNELGKAMVIIARRNDSSY